MKISFKVVVAIDDDSIVMLAWSDSLRLFRERYDLVLFNDVKRQIFDRRDGVGMFVFEGVGEQEDDHSFIEIVEGRFIHLNELGLDLLGLVA